MNIVYKPGKELFIADTLSRAFLPNKPSTEELKSEVLSVKQEEYLIKSIEEISMVEFLPITSERLVDLRRKTELDEGLQQLKHIIKIGWPETKEEVPSEIRRYFDFKEELSIQDGILFKGNRVIVPVAHFQLQTCIFFYLGLIVSGLVLNIFYKMSPRAHHNCL